MNGTLTDYSYIGVGKIYMRDRNGTGGLVPIGNVSALNFAAAEEVKSLPDHTSGGGGTRNEVRRVSGVEAKITIHDLSPDNLALALYGDTTAVAASSVTDEAISAAKKGAINPLAHAGASSVVVTSNDGITTYTAGTDYEVRPAGIWIPDTSTITADAPLKVDYSYPGQDVVQALTQAAGEYELLFDGVNEARSGKACVVRAHRLRFGPAGDMPLIGDDYAGMELTGTLLADDSQAVGISRYFTTTIIA